MINEFATHKTHLQARLFIDPDEFSRSDCLTPHTSLTIYNKMLNKVLSTYMVKSVHFNSGSVSNESSL